MSKLHFFIISTVFILLGFVNIFHESKFSFNPAYSVPVALGVGSSAPDFTPTPTFTLTPTSTPTSTPTNTPTMTPTATPTFTPTPTPIPNIIVVDNTDIGFYSTGVWKAVTNGTGFTGTNYLHDNNNQKGKKSARWALNFPIGTYQVFVKYVSNSNRATNVPYVITHANGSTSTIVINQQINGGQWVPLGTYFFNGAGTVSINTANTNGYVVADSVRFEQVFN